MTEQNIAPPLFAQLLGTLVAVGTPWLVVSIVRRITGVRPGSVESQASWHRLVLMTLVVTIVAVAGSLLLPRPSPWIFGIDLPAFGLLAAFAFPALTAIDRDSRAQRIVEVTERTASLTPRRASDHLPWTWRGCFYAIGGIGLTWFVVRLMEPVTGRLELVPSVFAFAALMFFWLYETWIKQVVTGPRVADDSSVTKSQLARRIFVVELVLVGVSLTVAHVLLDIDWTVHSSIASAFSLAGGFIGIAGCAVALSSALIGRRYAAVK